MSSGSHSGGVTTTSDGVTIADMKKPFKDLTSANPFVKSLDCEPSCLEGEPEFVMLFRKDDLKEEIAKEFEDEEEEDDLEYFNTFSTRE
ncbi:hypothetical protein Tco_0227321 [Tanacetum coccineum]